MKAPSTPNPPTNPHPFFILLHAPIGFKRVFLPIAISDISIGAPSNTKRITYAIIKIPPPFIPTT